MIAVNICFIALSWLITIDIFNKNCIVNSHSRRIRSYNHLKHSSNYNYFIVMSQNSYLGSCLVITHVVTILYVEVDFTLSHLSHLAGSILIG